MKKKEGVREIDRGFRIFFFYARREFRKTACGRKTAYGGLVKKEEKKKKKKRELQYQGLFFFPPSGTECVWGGGWWWRWWWIFVFVLQNQASSALNKSSFSSSSSNNLSASSPLCIPPAPTFRALIKNPTRAHSVPFESLESVTNSHGSSSWW